MPPQGCYDSGYQDALARRPRTGFAGYPDAYRRGYHKGLLETSPIRRAAFWLGQRLVMFSRTPRPLTLIKERIVLEKRKRERDRLMEKYAR